MALIFITLHLMLYPIFYMALCHDEWRNPNYVPKYGAMFLDAFNILGTKRECKFIDDRNIAHYMDFDFLGYLMFCPLPYLGFLIALKIVNKYISNKVMTQQGGPNHFFTKKWSWLPCTYSALTQISNGKHCIHL